MAITDRQAIKNWFIRSAMPTRLQFWAWLDSFWHKNDQIPVESIEGLIQILAEINQAINNSAKFKGYFTTSASLSAAHPSPEAGATAWVGVPYPGKVYKCEVAGTWIATTDTPQAPVINLDEYAKIQTEAGIVVRTPDGTIPIPENVLVDNTVTSFEAIDSTLYLVTSGYYINDLGQKIAINDSATRKFIYRLPVVVKNNVVIAANFPISDAINSTFINVYINKADGTYLGSFRKDSVIDGKIAIHWPDQQDCFISYYTDYVDSARGYNYNINPVTVTQDHTDRSIKFQDGTIYPMTDLVNKPDANLFTELTSTIWDGSNKYLTLTADKELYFTTTQNNGKLSVKKGWYDTYKLFINGKELYFRGNAVIEYIASNGMIIFYINDQKMLTLPQDTTPRKTFTGKQSDVITSSDAALLTTGAFSLGVTATIAANGFLAIGRGTSTVRYWDFLFTNYQTSGAISASISANGGNGAIDSSVTLNTPYKFIITYNGYNALIIYKNGVKISEVGTTAITAGGTFNLGSVLALISNGSEARDVFMTNKALSLTEVKEMYLLKSPLNSTFKANVIKYWDFANENTMLLPNEPKATFSQKYDPILLRGSSTWDSGDIANPDVVEDTIGVSGYKYIMNYSAYGTITGDMSAKWRMCLAYSYDLENWVKDAANPIFSPNANEGYIAANGSIVIFNNLYYHFYQRGKSADIASSQICLATSPDLHIWTRQNGGNPVILPGTGSDFDNLAVFDPCVRVYDNTFIMLYSANGGNNSKIGMATSVDGITWVKKGAIITQTGGASEPSFCRIGKLWYISHDIYTNTPVSGSREIFGSWWDGASPVTTEKVLAAGLAPWKSQAVFDSALFYANGKLYIHFAGGNNATSNQGLNANIGISLAQI